MKKPLTGLFIGIGAVFAGFFLYHVFQTSPDSSFPAGRMPAYSLCYLLILLGLGYMYACGVQKQWFSGSSLGFSILVAGGLSLLAMVPVLMVFGKHHGPIQIAFVGFAFRLPDPIGRVFILPFMLIFASFALLAWWEIVKQLLGGSRPKQTGVLHKK